MTYTLDDIYSQLNEIKLMMAENSGSGWKSKNAEGLYASAIGEGAEVEGSRFLNLIHNVNTALERTKSNLRGIYGDVKHMVEPWAAVDTAASKYAKTIAMTEEGMKRLRKTTIDNVVNAKIGINYNVSQEELIQYQQKYVQSVGRALRIDNTQQESLAALHAVMDGRENELAAAFENFGVSLNGVADHAGKMFADASKSGLSFEKYSDNVAKNIKIAQNYTFKNGLKGLESMAKKATAIKLDMGQVASFADKVSTIEGAIDVASKLQVLGGSFAGIADPLGMLNEGLMDMEGLTDRVIKMIGGMGAFNKQTGEVEVSAFNKQRIKAAAQAMGMDYSQLMESVNAGAKREEITRQISASANATGLDDKMKELIKNSATFENGKAGVSINGEFKTLDDLTNEDYKDLVKETQDQAADIKDIARTLRGFKDMEEGTKKQYRAVKAQHGEMGLGEGVKQLVGWAGKQTRLLRIIAAGSWAKSIMGMFENVVNLIGGWGNIMKGKNWTGDRSIFADSMGSGGLYGNGIGRGRGRGLKEHGKYANKIGRSNRLKGTKFEKGGNKIIEKAGKSSIKEISGRFGASSITRVDQIGAKLTSKGYTKLGSAVSRHAEKQAIKHGMSSVAKQGGKRIAAKTATKIGTKMAAGVAKGGIAGIIGAAGNIATDMLVESGNIKKGGTGHTAMKVGSTALEGAALGATIGSIFPGIGTAIGAAVGAIGGAVVGSVKMAKIKREQALDNKLSTIGLERKGEYGAWGLKRINNALDDGNISRRLRRKLERQGDTAILAQIDAKKKEKEEEKEKKKDRRAERWGKILGGGTSSIANGQFNVGVAYINAGKFERKIKGKPETGISNIKGLPEEGFSRELAGLKKSAELFGQKKGDLINKQQSENQNSLNGGKIDLNISGTIKLEGANGKQVDITKDLLKDSNFIREITKLITQRIGENQVGSNRQDNNNMARTI